MFPSPIEPSKPALRPFIRRADPSPRPTSAALWPPAASASTCARWARLPAGPRRSQLLIAPAFSRPWTQPSCVPGGVSRHDYGLAVGATCDPLPLPQRPEELADLVGQGVGLLHGRKMP